MVAGGIFDVVETPFDWLVLGSAILDLIVVVVAKRDRLPRVDGLTSEIRESRDIEVKGLSLILSQVRYL